MTARRILVTGSAGFIGSHLTLRLLGRGDTVIGLDNHNDYYDPAIKEARLARFSGHPAYTHLRLDLANRSAIESAFAEHKPQRVVNLAAQAGVRYSTENPAAYVQANIPVVREQLLKAGIRLAQMLDESFAASAH
jgi:UDP-glucuronate 4-epimerase